jgi:hypothetical protein
MVIVSTFMANYLLIDTCSLRNLVSKTEFNPDLLWTEKLIKEKDFSLLVPDALLSEWSRKHREEELQRINKALLNHRKEKKISALFEANPEEFEKRYGHAERKLISQLELIDELLKQGIQIKPSNKVKGVVFDHRAKRLAPFQRNDESFNDASIIFSGLDYISDLDGENSLFFVSSNSNDFGFKNGDKLIINPEIIQEYPTVDVSYFENCSGLKSSLHPADSDRENRDSKLNPIITINKNQPLLDQLFEYLTLRFKELKFLPAELFAYHYLFIIIQKKPYYSPAFTIATDNSDLFALFRALLSPEISSLETTSDPPVDSKWNKISKFLFNNHISFIIHERENRLQLNRFPSKPTPIRSAFESFQFNIVFDLVQHPDTDKFEKAYYLYKLGLFNQSAHLMQKAIELANDNFPTLAFIGWFNLARLKVFISNNYDQVPDKTLLKELDAFDINEKIRISTLPDNKEILSYINDRKFITETLAKLQESLNEIRDDFYTQCGGFHSSMAQLLFHFANLESFMTYNFIVYDYFSEFTEIVEIFTEGLFASYACSSGLGGHLVHFDDYMLNKLVIYGNPAFIKKCASRYRLDSLKYDKNGEQEDTFIDWATNLFKGIKDFLEGYQTIPGAALRFLKDLFQKFVLNIFTLGSLISLDEDSSEKFSEFILRFADEQDFIFKQKMIEAILYYVSKKYKILSKEILIRFFLLGIYNPSFHASDYLQDIQFYLSRRGILLDLEKADIDQITDEFISECPKCKTHHSLDMLGSIFTLIKSDEFKKVISEKTTPYISVQFNANDYANAVLFDIVQPTVLGDGSFIDQINTVLNSGKIGRLYTTDNFYSDNRIDSFLNTWFKYGFSIPIDTLEKIQNLDPYYKWLIDPDEFDYQAFSPEWLHHNFTKFYKQHFRKSSVLKAHIMGLLKEKFDERLARFYMTTYDMGN